MNMFFHAHTGFRFLVLTLAFANLVVLLLGLAQKKAPGTLHRVLMSSFVGSMHLQVLLGIGTAFARPWQGMYIGHIVMMGVGTVLAQAMMVVNKKRPQPGHTLPLIGVAGALLCIFIGVMAIGRGLFTMTAG